MSSALREVLARFDVRVAGAPQVRAADRQVTNLTQSLRALPGALSGAAYLTAARRFIQSQVDIGDELDKTSRALGISTGTLQAWRHGGALAGVDAATLGGALTRLTRAMGQAESGSAPAIRMFEDLGVSIRDSSGNLRSLDEMLPDIAEGFSRIQNPAERAIVAQRLFGTQGARMLPMLAGGREGFFRMRQELEALGGGVSETAIQRAAELADEQQRLNIAVGSLKSALAEALMPAIINTTKLLTDMVVFVRNSPRALEALEAAFVSLGAVAVVVGVKSAIALAAILIPAAKAAAVVALLYLSFRDLSKFFSEDRSHESYFGQMLDFMDEVVGFMDIIDAWGIDTEGFALSEAVREGWREFYRFLNDSNLRAQFVAYTLDTFEPIIRPIVQGVRDLSGAFTSAKDAAVDTFITALNFAARLLSVVDRIVDAVGRLRAGDFTGALGAIRGEGTGRAATEAAAPYLQRAARGAEAVRGLAPRIPTMEDITGAIIGRVAEMSTADLAREALRMTPAGATVFGARNLAVSTGMAVTGGSDFARTPAIRDTNITISDTGQTVFNISGPDADEVASRVERIMERKEQARQREMIRAIEEGAA